ncbi:N-acetyltransferase family protein [Mycolicibacterium thermoresistibile]
MEPVTVQTASGADAAALAEVAGRTFPLACPPSVSPQNIAAFVAEQLSEDRFGDYLHDPDRVVLIARQPGIIGYAMLIRGAPDDPQVRHAVPARPSVEVSKFYVLPEHHGRGSAAALMTAVREHAENLGAACLWLGVNQHNHRARRFYTKHGFTVAGTRTFRLGGQIEHDYVMVCPL